MVEMVRVALALLLVAAAAEAANYTVGDEKGWNPDVDYTAWVKKHKPFYKGDWLSKIPFSSLLLLLAAAMPASLFSSPSIQFDDGIEEEEEEEEQARWC